MPYQVAALIVIEIWRAVERDLEKAAPGSPEEDRLRAEAARLRDEYQDLVELALEHGRPAPPAFPAA